MTKLDIPEFDKLTDLNRASMLARQKASREEDKEKKDDRTDAILLQVRLVNSDSVDIPVDMMIGRPVCARWEIRSWFVRSADATLKAGIP